MNYFQLCIWIIIASKIGFILMAISHLFLKANGKINSELDKKFVYWKERFEFIFIFLMSLLIIYLFNPRYNKSVLINNEIKILLYLFGFILLISAKWETFFHESKWFKYIKEILK